MVRGFDASSLTILIHSAIVSLDCFISFLLNFLAYFGSAVLYSFIANSLNPGLSSLANVVLGFCIATIPALSSSLENWLNVFPGLSSAWEVRNFCTSSPDIVIQRIPLEQVTRSSFCPFCILSIVLLLGFFI